jgi:hypothetical protein
MKVERLQVERPKERLKVERPKKKREKAKKLLAVDYYTVGGNPSQPKLWAGWDGQLSPRTGPACRPI